MENRRALEERCSKAYEFQRTYMKDSDYSDNIGILLKYFTILPHKDTHQFIGGRNWE